MKHAAPRRGQHNDVVDGAAVRRRATVTPVRWGVVVGAVLVTPLGAGCDQSITRTEPGCQGAEFVGCTTTADGRPAATSCFWGDVTAIVECDAVCGHAVDSCTVRTGVTSPADVCDCPICAGQQDCADDEFCGFTETRLTCRTTPPGRFWIAGIDVSVPALDVNGRPWDADGLPDVQVELLLDGAVWWTSPTVADAQQVSIVGDERSARDLLGAEKLEVDVFDVDGDQRVFIDGAEFFRIGSVLDERGYDGTLFDAERPTTVNLDLAESGDEP